MFVTTLLSCRWLEPITIAKLQAIAFFIGRCCRIVCKQSSQVVFATVVLHARKQ
jgi:hypothetical protein